MEPTKFQDVDIAIENFYRKVAHEILSLEGAGAGGGIAVDCVPLLEQRLYLVSKLVWI